MWLILREEKYVNENGKGKYIVSIDKESANKQQAKRIFFFTFIAALSFS